mmetsp:Transcript_55531/g.125170  ORF Transcript_55531/g.125170 Transcript_55531/m.125170 type:complete len:238 (-) Transcript_55531:1024-1737(-)
MAKSGLRKRDSRSCRTTASSSRSARSMATWVAPTSGGMKSSASSRLSHRPGWYKSLRSVFSSSGSADFSMFDQKELPTNSLVFQLPAGTSVASMGDASSNLSRLRSTPLGTPGARTGNSATAPRADTMRAVRDGTLAATTRPGGARTPGTRPRRSTPSSTPPYTPNMRLPDPFSASTILPSATWIWETACSFQSCGISVHATGSASPATLNQDSSRGDSFSRRNLAVTVAFASSRRW